MNISFIIKASPEVGYGHLIRSRHLANIMYASKSDDDRISYYAIGDKTLHNLLSDVSFEYRILESESDLIKHCAPMGVSQVVIFDLLEVTDGLMDALHNATSLVSLSPIFSHMDEVNFLFHRTKYHNHLFIPKTRVYKGLSYALIQEGCRRIPTDLFKNQLYENKLSIAISMGGADAANQTLKVIREINQLKEDYIVWVMIGEGYKHSYDELIEESKKSHHEIILSKTNSSMWKVLSLTSLLILPGGITTYEAAYAGLPTINIVKNRKQRFLIQELLENNLCDEVNDITSLDLVKKIDYYYNNREELVKMHSNSKGSIDGLGAHRICEILKKEALQ